MKKLNWRQSALVSAFVIFTSVAAHAKAPIAVVDLQLIWDKSAAAEEARNQIKIRKDALTSELKKKEEELKKEDEELTKKRSALAADAYEAKRKEFKEKQMKIAGDLQRKRENIEKSVSKAVNTVQASIIDIVANLAKEKEFDVAIYRTQVLYASQQLDLTADVLKILNQKLPKIDIEVKDTAAKASTPAKK